MAPQDEHVLSELIAGKRLVVTDDFMDAVAHTDYGSEIRTARNAQQIGTKDVYVAWITDTARPDMLCQGDCYVWANP